MIWLERLRVRVDQASFRERVLLFVAAGVVLTFLWDSLLMSPLATRRVAFAQALEEQRQRLANGQGDGPEEQYSALKSRETALRAAIAATDAELRDAQQGMIPPKQLVTALTEVLAHQRSLALVLLKNLPVETLTSATADHPATAEHAEAPGSPGSVGASGPYVHPVELVLRGDYLSVLAYLRELEARAWGFQWRRFEFISTEDGPEYRIQFTTLSMQSDWSGA